MKEKEILESVLFDPLSLGCDEIRILSGRATASMASRYIELLKKRSADYIIIRIIVGMASAEGIVDIQHENFKKLVRECNGKFESSYIMLKHIPCHAKVYVWLKEGKPIKAFTGSADFTQNAFYALQHEAMIECDPQNALDYYNSFSEDTIFCDHSEVEDTVTILSRQQYRDKNSELEEVGDDVSIKNKGFPSQTLSLLGTKGEIGERSGLNWGQRERRDKNQTYIPLQRHVAKSGFFPSKDQHFTVITDDGFSMICSVAQGDEKGKAIHTPLDNGELGRYFRKRIDIPSGAYVKKEDLERYGRTDVTFFKIDNETYYMDFSV